MSTIITFLTRTEKRWRRGASPRSLERISRRGPPDISIEVMDQNRIQTAISSLSAPGVYFGGGVAQAQALARECNEFSARMAADFPGRFGFFAVLPMLIIEASCEEATYALDTLDSGQSPGAS